VLQQNPATEAKQKRQTFVRVSGVAAAAATAVIVLVAQIFDFSGILLVAVLVELGAQCATQHVAFARSARNVIDEPQAVAVNLGGFPTRVDCS
jgi:hypothetical protein